MRSSMKVNRTNLVARASITDLKSSRQAEVTTWDVSPSACLVMSGGFAAIGDRISVQITHKGKAFEAEGKVINLRPFRGLIIVFTKVEKHHKVILGGWLAALR